MTRTNLKFDKTNSINSNNNNNKKTTSKNNTSSGKTKVVGIRIDTKSTSTKEKVYYYKTNKDFKRGDRLRVRVPSGGSPKSTVAVANSNKKGNYKNLIEG
jgi:hypothetical protein